MAHPHLRDEQLQQELATLRRRVDDLEQRSAELEAECDAHRESERHSQEYVAKWRSLVENAPNVILTVNRDAEILFINWTLTEEERVSVIGQSICDFTSAEYHDLMKDTIREVFRTGQPGAYESRSLDEYGPMWFTNNVGPVKRDGEVVAAVIISSDITEHKRLEAELREIRTELEERVEARTAKLTEANARLHREIECRQQAQHALHQRTEELQAIYDGMVDGVLIAEAETRRFVRANRAICRMLGYSKEELLSMSVLDLHPAESLPYAVRTFDAQAKGQRRAAEEALVRRKDGSVFFADIVGRRVVYHRRLCLIAFFRDISERKAANEALRQERETLCRLVESSDRDRKLTAYEIHDGFTQEIAAAKMFLEVYWQLKDKASDRAKHSFDRCMELLGSGISEARRLISGLRPPILDDEGVVAAVEHLVRDPHVNEGLEIRFVHDVKPGRLAPLLENGIFRIVQESVTNTCQHSKSPTAEVRLTQADGRIRIEVEDWGVGFDPKKVAETCFGLGGIKERARLLGGDVIVRSHPGCGTLIRVDLPLIATGQFG